MNSVKYKYVLILCLHQKMNIMLAPVSKNTFSSCIPCYFGLLSVVIRET